jgi:predicted TIM-barrel fold metal-dependent hydrolase
MKRRNFLIGSGTMALAAGAGAAYVWPEQGLLNPCKADLPPQLASHELVRAAWEGVDASRMWDCHVHLIGVGDSSSGVWINPRMQSWAHPLEFAQRLFFLNAGCAHDAPGRVDASYVERMRHLADALAPGAKLMLLAFDYTHDEAGERQPARSAFHTPDSYAQGLAHAQPRYFEWIASIHPYRRDCVQALERAAQQGARAVKWLPPAMGIDPGSARCDPFYAAAARLNLPLLTHAGEEKAVHGAAEQGFGNPLKLRRALDHGVRVVVAHCASLGQDIDLDRGEHGPATESFELFARLMDDAKYVGKIFGDISAIAQVNRSAAALRRIVERSDWHARLLNGSDYPLPGVMPLISVSRVVDLGLVERSAAQVLMQIRAHNPLLFDFVLKRLLRSGDKRLAPSVFHTRDFFLARPSQPGPDAKDAFGRRAMY